MSTLAVVALSSAKAKARDAKSMSDLKAVSMALERYYLDWGEYPSTYPAPGPSLIVESSCGISNSYPYIVFDGWKLCKNTPFKKGTSMYMTSLPKTSNSEHPYYYLNISENYDNLFKGSVVFIDSLEGSQKQFVCVNGACRIVDNYDDFIICSFKFSWSWYSEEDCAAMGYPGGV